MLEAGEYQSCAVCARTMLRGERPSEYVDPDGAAMTVCAVCKPRAEEAGWRPAGSVPEPPRQAPKRRRGGTAAIRERFARRPAHPSDPGLTDQPSTPPSPIEVFNTSAEVRKVAALAKSLGAPRVSIRAASAEAELITVAWDLSWYQWSVRGSDVREVARGDEISELPGSDRDWNAVAAADGTLSLA